jgi:hypothetical protein
MLPRKAMTISAFGRAVLVFIAHVISFCNLFWLISLRSHLGFMTLANRVCWICAFYSVGGLFGFVWATGTADICKVWGWSIWLCRRAGLTVFAPLCLLLFVCRHVNEARPSFNILALAIFLNIASFTGMAPQRLAFPNADSKDLYGPEKPLSLFGK